MNHALRRTSHRRILVAVAALAFAALATPKHAWAAAGGGGAGTGLGVFYATGQELGLGYAFEWGQSPRIHRRHHHRAGARATLFAPTRDIMDGSCDFPSSSCPNDERIVN
jgi:hypothetical protein